MIMRPRRRLPRRYVVNHYVVYEQIYHYVVNNFPFWSSLVFKMEKYSYDDFKNVLLSYQVCAWGECYTKENER